MIINSIADGQVQANDLVTFNPRDILYTIKGSSGSLTGTVAAQSYASVNAAATGRPPYEVTLGYVNQSYQAKPVTVDRDDAMVTFWMCFPAGPNGPTTLVYANQT